LGILKKLASSKSLSDNKNMNTHIQKLRNLLVASVLVFCASGNADGVRSWVNLDNFETAGRYDDIVFTPDMTGFAINANGTHQPKQE